MAGPDRFALSGKFSGRYSLQDKAQKTDNK